MNNDRFRVNNIRASIEELFFGQSLHQSCIPHSGAILVAVTIDLRGSLWKTFKTVKQMQLPARQRRLSNGHGVGDDSRAKSRCGTELNDVAFNAGVVNP